MYLLEMLNSLDDIPIAADETINAIPIYKHIHTRVFCFFSYSFAHG